MNAFDIYQVDIAALTFGLEMIDAGIANCKQKANEKDSVFYFAKRKEINGK